ncbi:MAG: hypothetical protein ACYS47_06850 [Planctomycetota bacterium]
MLLLVFSVQGMACKTTEYWSFRATRFAFEKDKEGKSIISESARHDGCGPGVVLLTTAAVDLVMLPFAVIHDIWLYHNKERLKREQFHRLKIEGEERRRLRLEREECELRSIKPWNEEEWASRER